MDRQIVQNPLVSIIVPVYNAEKYLSASLNSICNQTLRELEIIVVDDGSTDRSGQIAEEYAAKDTRIKVVHKRNGNPGATRNIGLALVTSEYVGFIDSDDWIEADMYRTMYELITHDNSDLVVCGVSVDYTRDKRSILYQVENTYTENDPDCLLEMYFDLTEKKLFAYPVNKLYRTNLIRKYQLQFPEVLPYEDLMFNLNYYVVLESVSLLPGVFYHYMRREELSAAGAYSPDHLHACKMTENVFCRFFEVYNNNNIDVVSYLRSRRISDYLAYACGFYKRNSPLTRKERIAYLEKDFVKNMELKQDLLLTPPVGLYQKIFYFFVFTTTPTITDYIYQFLFYMRYNFDSVYRKFRRYISR